MNFDLKGLVEKHTVEGVVDYAKAQEDFQTQFNGFDAKQKTLREEALVAARGEGTSEFIKTLGIENVSDKEGFLKYSETLKTSATDKDLELSKIREQYKDYDSNKEALVKANGLAFSNEVKTKLGVKFDSKYVEDQFELIKHKINEDKSNVDELVKAQSENENYKSWLKNGQKQVFVKKNESDKTDVKKVVNKYAKFYN